MSEGDSHLTTLHQSFERGRVGAITVEIAPDPAFDTQTDAWPDAFEVHLVQPSGLPWLAPWKPGSTAVFSLQQDGVVHTGPAAAWDGARLTLDLRAIPADATARLVFAAIGADAATESRVRLGAITPTWENQAPVAALDTPETVACNVPFTLDGGASWDPDGDSLVIIWTEADGTPIAEGATWTASFAADRTARLVVTDPFGAFSSIDVPITVVDQTPPRLTLPLPTYSGAAGGPACDAEIPTVTVDADDVCSAVTVQQTPAAGTLVGPGDHPIVVRVTDAAGLITEGTTVFSVAGGCGVFVDSGATDSAGAPSDCAVLPVDTEPATDSDTDPASDVSDCPLLPGDTARTDLTDSERPSDTDATDRPVTDVDPTDATEPPTDDSDPTDTDFAGTDVDTDTLPRKPGSCGCDAAGTGFLVPVLGAAATLRRRRRGTFPAFVLALPAVSALMLTPAHAHEGTPPTPIDLGDRVDQVLDADTTDAHWRFTADPGQVVFLDMISADHPYETTWRLTDAAGRDVRGPGPLTDLGRTSLMGGVYTLSAARGADVTSSFAFQVLPTADTSAVGAPGASLPGAVSAGSRAEYAVDLPATTDLTLLFSAASDPWAATWSLIDEAGRSVASAPYLGDTDGIRLTGGRYTLRVAAAGASPSAFSVRLLAESPVEASLPEGQTADCGITGPAQTRTFHLDLPTDRSVALETLDGNGSWDLGYTLTNAHGDVLVRTDRFQTTAPVPLVAGRYTWTVSTRGAASVDGSVRWRTVPETEGGTLALDAPTTATFAIPGETITWDLPLATESVLWFSGEGSAVWDVGVSVRDADDRLIIPAGSDASWLGPWRLAAGSYRITLDAEGDATPELPFRVRAPSTATRALALGATDTASFEAGDAVTWTIPGAAGRVVDLDVTTTTPSHFTWEITAGPRRIAGDGALVDRAAIPVASGAATLTVRSQFGRAGTASVTVRDAGAATAPASASSLPTGAPTSGTLAAADAVARYALTVPNDATLYLDTTVDAPGLRWRLLDGAGLPAADWRDAALAMWHDLELALEAGVYTLEITGSTGPWQIRPYLSAASAGPANLDAPVAGTITSPGENDVWTFDIASPTAIYADLTTGFAGLRWTLADEAGRVRFTADAVDTYWHDQQTIDLDPGQYALTIDPAGAATGAYAFTVRTTTPASRAVALNDDLSGLLTGRGATETLRFTVPEAQEVLLDLTGTTGRFSATLRDPLGVARATDLVLADPYWHDQGPFWLSAGEWTLELSTQREDVADWELSLRSAGARRLVASLDTPVAGVTSAAAPAELVFNVAEAGPYALDVQINQPGIEATVLDAAGGVVLGRTVTTDAYYHDQGQLLLAPGPYTVRLDARGGPPAAFQVALRPAPDLGSSTTPGAAWMGTTTRPGERLIVDLPIDDTALLGLDLEISGGPSTWVLLDPHGEPVFAPREAGNTEQDPTLPSLLPGTYQVIIDPAWGVTGTWAFRTRIGDPSDRRLFYTRFSGAPNVKQSTWRYVDGEFSAPVQQAVATTPAADGLIVLPDGRLLVGGGGVGVSRVDPETGAFDVATGFTAYHLALDPDGTRVWSSDMPGSLVEISLVDFGAFTLHTLNGSDAVVTHLAFDRRGRAFYTASGSAGNGSFGSINLDTFTTTRVHSNLPAAHGLAFDPFTDTLLLSGAGHLTQISPDTLEIIADLAVPGVQFDQGTADGAGHAFVASNLGQLVFVDYAATGRVDHPDNYVYVAPFDSNLDDVAPLSWLGSACAGTPPITELAPAAGTAFAPGARVLITGRAQAVDPTRPIAAVFLDGRPVDALDATGRFFAAVDVPAGGGVWTVEAQDRCGATTATVRLSSTGGDAVFAELTDVSARVHATWSDTTVGLDGDRLLVDVAAQNTSDEALHGPLLMVFGDDLPAAVTVALADGRTPDGAPFLSVLGEGESLAPGATSARKTVSLNNPSGIHPWFTPRWLAPGNHAPAFAAAPPVDLSVGHPWVFAATATDPDGDALRWSLDLAPADVTLDDAGGLRWTPAAGDVGEHAVRVTVSDGHGGAATLSFTLRVAQEARNRPPLFTTAPVTHASVGAAWTYAAGATDPDGDPITWSLVDAPAGLTLDADLAVLSWDFALPGRHEVVVAVADGVGGEARQAFLLHVGEIPADPNAPQITSVPPTVAAVASLWLYQPLAFDADGDALTWTIVEGPSEIALDPDSGRLTWTPEADDLGDHVVTLAVASSEDAATTQTFTLTVNPTLPDRAPVFSTAPPTTAIVGEPWTYDASALDPEVAGVTYTLAASPAGAAIDPVTGVVTWTPADADEAALFAVVATDAAGQTSSQTFRVHVRAENLPPTWITTDLPPTAVGADWVAGLNAVDPEGDAITWTIASGPAGLTVDAGWLWWRPDTAGDAPVTVVATDALGAASERTFTVQVRGDTTPPSVALTPSGAPGCLGAPLTVCARASDDVAVDTLTITVDGAPTEADAAGCVTLTAGVPRTWAIAAVATDRAGSEGEASLTAAIADCNDAEAPVVVIHSPAISAVLEAPVPVLATITDNQPAAMLWTVELSPRGAETWTVIGAGAGEADGEVAVLDPTLFANGDWDLRVRADDGAQFNDTRIPVAFGGDFKPGRYAFSVTDLHVSLGGVPLTVARRYDTLDAPFSGDFGHGWRLGVAGGVSDTPLESTAPDAFIASLAHETFWPGARVWVDKTDGTRVGFTFNPAPYGFPPGLGAPAWTPDPGVTDTLEADGPTVLTAFTGQWRNFFLPYNPSQYTLVTAAGVRYVYTEADGLVRVETVDGAAVDVTDDGLVHSSGLTVRFVRDEQGRIIEITEPEDGDPSRDPMIRRYTYDDAGDLTSVTDGAGTKLARYEYAAHRLTAMDDAAGLPVVRNVYDAEGRLSATCGPTGDVDTLAGCQTFDWEVTAGVSSTWDAAGRRTDRAYDAAGNVVLERNFRDDGSAVDLVATWDDAHHPLTMSVEGATWTWSWDGDGHLTSMVAPGGWRTDQTWGACGVTRATNSRGDARTFTYDDGCRLLRTDLPGGGVVTYGWEDGQNTRVTRDGVVWRFVRDSEGRVIGLTNPAGHSASFTYSPLGDLITAIDADGHEIRYTWDSEHRPLTETWVGEDRTITYTWSPTGQLLGLSDPDATLGFEWTPLGQLAAEHTTPTGGPAAWRRYAWTATGQLDATTDSFGGTTTRLRDDFDRLTGLVQAAPEGEARVGVAWEGTQIRQIWRAADVDANAGAVTTELGWTAPGSPWLSSLRHTAADGTPIAAFGFTRDPWGALTGWTDAEGAHTAQVDGQDRLIAVDHPGSMPDEAYRWDGARRTSSHRGPVTWEAAPEGVSDRLAADDTWRYTWTNAGRLARRVSLDGARTDTFTWDARGRLVRLVRAAAGATTRDVQYRYDALDRRIAVIEGGTTTFVFHEANNPVLEAVDGQVRVRRLYGEQLDGVLAEHRDGDTTFPLGDHLGTVRDRVAADGAPRSHATYDAFGARISGGGGLGFAGRPHDDDAGLVDLRARVYDPSTGRFLSPDPLAPYGYDYAAGDPLTVTDPTGRAVAVEYVCLAVEAYRKGKDFAENIAAPMYSLYMDIAISVETLSVSPTLNPSVNGMGGGVGGYLGSMMPFNPYEDLGENLDSMREDVEEALCGSARGLAPPKAPPAPTGGVWTGTSWTKGPGFRL